MFCIFQSIWKGKLQPVWPEKICQMSIKSWPKMISLEKWFWHLYKNVRDFGKFIVAKGFKKLPKVQKIAQSGHTDYNIGRHKTHILKEEANKLALSLYFDICEGMVQAKDALTILFRL